jgi:hypothetical protein
MMMVRAMFFKHYSNNDNDVVGSNNKEKNYGAIDDNQEPYKKIRWGWDSEDTASLSSSLSDNDGDEGSSSSRLSSSIVESFRKNNDNQNNDAIVTTMFNTTIGKTGVSADNNDDIESQNHRIMCQNLSCQHHHEEYSSYLHNPNDDKDKQSNKSVHELKNKKNLTASEVTAATALMVSDTLTHFIYGIYRLSL